MNLIVPILITYTLYWIIEVIHDNKLRLIGNSALKNSESATEKDDVVDWVKDWHTWDWRGHALLALLISGVCFSFYMEWKYIALPVAIGLQRMMILNIGTKIAQGSKNILELGSNPIDKWLYKTFGKLWILPTSLVFVGLILLMLMI